MTLLTLILYIAVAAAILTGIIGLLKKGHKNWIMTFLQNFTGILFIISGLVKAVDPMGTAFKMEQYFTEFEYTFADTAMSFMAPLFPFLSSISLIFSVTMIVLEIVLGLMLVLGHRPKLTSWAFLLLVIFFTILTGFTFMTGYVPSGVNFFQFSEWGPYTETNMRVTDCGCFGDFLKLKPYETFIKDIILSAMILFVWIFRKHLTKFINIKEYGVFIACAVFGFFLVTLLGKFGMQGNINTLIVGLVSAIIYGLYQYKSLPSMASWLPFALGSILTVWFTFRNITNLPWINFRHYKIGQDLRKCTNEEGLDPGESIKMFTLKNKKDQSTMVASDKDYMNQKLYTEWEVVPGKTTETIIREAQEPPCKDFHVFDAEGGELKDSLLNYKGYSIWVTSYSLDKANKEGFTRINNLIKEVKTPETLVIGLSNSDITKANSYSGSLYNFNNLDATPIKTMMRSNPGIVVVKDGMIKGLYHHNHLPSAAELKALMK